MKLTIPELSLVVLIGASGSGKSTFAATHFKSTEILSSDYFRGLVSDDRNDQTVTDRAFDALHYIASHRLALGKLTVIDATNVQPESRKSLVALARNYHCLPVAIALDLPGKLCIERNKTRPDRDFGHHVVTRQRSQLQRSLKGLKREGFRHSYVLSSVEEIAAVEIERQPLWNNRKSDRGPFDIIGDIHGCFEETKELLETLGYAWQPESGYDFGRGYRVSHPQGRKVIFLGDIVDRGPGIPEMLRLVMSMVADRTALCVPGNHEIKLVRKLRGKNVKLKHGLAETVEQLEPETVEFKHRVETFLDKLVSHYVLDDGKLVVAHAGMKEEYQGRGSGKVREFALYGETTGETDEFGLPIRHNWAAEYKGSATVVYGHTPVPEAQWLNRTINIDTGCVFGGKLTALRYPEQELVSVTAKRVYADPVKPLVDPGETRRSLQQEHDDVLDLEDVLGKLIINTRLRHNVTIREENGIAALELIGRFAVNPKWLIYLPPTMSPSETSSLPEYLEHPAEAFAHYASQGVERVICEQKHMGSRAIVVLCRDVDAAKERFGVTDGRFGICYTRTGRAFFTDERLEREFLERLKNAVTAAKLWEELETSWICLDCELMPWSAKAQELLKSQYAAVGSASVAALSEAEKTLSMALANGLEVGELLSGVSSRKQMATRFVEAYRRYCWSVNSINDLKLAPFHVMATEGAVHIDKPHTWHLQSIAKICQQDTAIFQITKTREISLADESDIRSGTDWWQQLTDKGGEGMVVKPMDFVSYGKKGLVQPGIKCRGREYLRIIYGPEYTASENLERLRNRGLSGKRSLALREFALGVEALERFVRREPLRRVHECVFGILALESEPVDPRL